MATTTNYGWTTPDDTALVKDGASAIRTLGSSVDTTTKALNPSTTLGDIEYRSSTANTNTRLGIGSTGQVLTVAGGVPSWATSSSGGMTLINTGGTTLTGASVTISSIPATYKNLQLIIRNFLPASDNSTIVLRINADNTANRYASKQDGSYIDFAFDLSQIVLTEGQVVPGTSTALAVANFFDYANTDTMKIIEIMSIGNAFTAGNFDARTFINYYKQTNAISSLVLLPDSGNFTSGTAFLYGVS